MKQSREWLAKADEDLASARVLIDSGHIANGCGCVFYRLSCATIKLPPPRPSGSSRIGGAAGAVEA